MTRDCSKKLQHYMLYDGQHPSSGLELHRFTTYCPLSEGAVSKKERNMPSGKVSMLLARHRKFQNHAGFQVVITNYSELRYTHQQLNQVLGCRKLIEFKQ